MTRVTDPATQQRLIGLVQKYLEPHQPHDYRLEVVPEGIEQDDDWYYVVVLPNRDGVPAYDYGARLVEAEMQLQDQEHMNVLLVPALVED